MVALAQVTAASAAPKAPSPEKKPAKGKKLTRLDHYNRRARYAQAIFGKLLDDVKAQAERAEEGTKPKKMLDEVVAQGTAAIALIEKVTVEFFKLSEAKWQPSKGGARLFHAGDAVALKARHTERFTKHGAYPLSELRGLKVVSVHGAAAKIQTAKGEALGLVALSWLTAA